MLHDYEILKKRTVWQACLKLIATICLLYSAFLVVPNVVDDVQRSREALNQAPKFRVIANSSSLYDQDIKQQVVESLQEIVGSLGTFPAHAYSIEQIVAKLQQKHPDVLLTYALGDNLLPPKWHNGILYPQNDYESFVIWIGQGRGENWFCAVFPTLCSPKTKTERPPSYFYEWWQKNKTKNNPQISENYTQDGVNY